MKFSIIFLTICGLGYFLVGLSEARSSNRKCKRTKDCLKDECCVVQRRKHHSPKNLGRCVKLGKVGANCILGTHYDESMRYKLFCPCELPFYCRRRGRSSRLGKCIRPKKAYRRRNHSKKKEAKKSRKRQHNRRKKETYNGIRKELVKRGADQQSRRKDKRRKNKQKQERRAEKIEKKKDRREDRVQMKKR